MQALIDKSITLGFRQTIVVIGDGQAESVLVLLHERLGFQHTRRM